MITRKFYNIIQPAIFQTVNLSCTNLHTRILKPFNNYIVSTEYHLIQIYVLQIIIPLCRKGKPNEALKNVSAENQVVI